MGAAGMARMEVLRERTMKDTAWERMLAIDASERELDEDNCLNTMNVVCCS
jgi:hypothetical protein